MKLPYTEDQLSEKRDFIKNWTDIIKRAEGELQDMERANRKVQDEAKRQNAQKLTPAGEKLLVELAKSDVRLNWYGNFRGSHLGHYSVSSTWEHPRADLVDKLVLAGYLRKVSDTWLDTTYVISDEGRAAIAHLLVTS